MGTDWYELQCDCDGDTPREIASIIDYRAAGTRRGGIFVNVNRPFSYRWDDAPVNRRGDHAGPHALRCGGRCGREIPAITDRTVADIIDRISPVREMLRVDPLPGQYPPWLGDLIESIGGTSRYVVPFATFCQVNSSIGDSR